MTQFGIFLLLKEMKATKQSVSLPAEMNAWIENEMKATRRSRSSLIQEAVEMLYLARSRKTSTPAVNAKAPPINPKVLPLKRASR